MFILPEEVNKALTRLEAAGYEAWLVGGWVRDCLLGSPPGDWDLCTAATPEETMAVFGDCRVIPTGLKHGTVTVLLAGLPLEITTFRVDGPYSDARRPDHVSFTRSIKEDLARRDFTVNAMAYHPQRGLFDPWGGQADLKARLIRCVGDAQVRFEEDPLRILRGLRFAAALGFALEVETERAMGEKTPKLSLVAAERIAQELKKLLCGKDAGRILLSYTDILGQILPELLPMKGFLQHTKYHCYDVLTHTAVALDHTPPEVNLRLAVLLHDMGKPGTFTRDKEGRGHFYGHGKLSAKMGEAILRRLRFDKASQEEILTLIKLHDTPIDLDEGILRRWLSRLGPEIFRKLLVVKRADNLGQAPQYHDRQAHYDRVEALAEKILREGQALTLHDLAVKGGDLLALGYAGREVGTALDTLLEALLDGRVKNQRAALLSYLAERGSGHGAEGKEG